MSDDLGAVIDGWVDETTDDETAPEAPQGDVSTASSGEDDSTPEATPGQPREKDGRFASKATDDAKETTAPAATPAPDAPVVAPDAAQPTTDVADSPFAFRSLGQEIPIEGAIRRADGSLVIPAASLPTVQQLFARGHEFQTRGMAERSQLQHEVKQLREQSNQPTLNERRYEAAYKIVADILDNNELMAQLALDPERKALYLERLGNTLDRVSLEHERTQRDRTTKADEGTQRETLESSAVSNSLEQIAAHHPELTPEDKEHLAGWVADMRAALIREATPEDAQQWGVTAGERVVDNTRILKYVAHIAGLRKAQATNAAKVQEAARFNKAQQPKPAPTAAKKPAATAPAVPAKTQGGRKDFDAFFKEWGKHKDLSFGDDDE